MKPKTECRVCGHKILEKVWDFGPTPLANSFKKDLNKPELFYPLEVYFCLNCKNVQLGCVIDPNLLFKNYLYESSTSKVFVKHFEDFASKMKKVKSVVDIGSNDGILLKPFKDRGVTVLGVEPAKNIAKKAQVPTLNGFFSVKMAKDIGKVDLVTCTNTFAHIDDIDSVTEGVKYMIGNKGIFVVEVQYLMDQLKFKYFDNVYHEHVQYWSVTALDKFFSMRGLKLYHVEHIDTHGGSIRAYIGKSPKINRSVSMFKRSEEKLDVDMLSDFAKAVAKNKIQLLKLLYNLKAQGATIVGYGAPAKSTTLCNYFGIGADILDYVIDDSPLKQGRYTPGKNIPIISANELGEIEPNYILILAWNFADSIVAKHEEYNYIIPVPEPREI